jgi:YfiH family protein
MLIPKWPAPKHIKAYTLTKLDSVNKLPLELRLLNQVHGNEVVDLSNEALELNADGAYSRNTNMACSIKTADCLAIFLCDQQGSEIAVLHGGWRGLAKGIIANGVKKFHAKPEKLITWLGPSICAKHYEIDKVVYENFVAQNAKFAHCFEQNRPEHWYCNLPQIARMQLQELGVYQIFSSDQCTFENEMELYSYRREPANPGRLIHTLWISKNEEYSR